jgi:hypothetical protein
MPSAEIVYVNIETNKYNEEQTQLSIGFNVDGGETKWMRYIVAGGSSGQQKFASMQLSKLLKLGGPVPVTVEKNDRGYDEVYADDGFRSGGAPAAVAVEGF